MKKTYFTLLVSCFCLASFAQQNQEISGAKIISYNSFTKLPNFIQINDQQDLRPENFAAWATDALHLPQYATLKAYSEERDQVNFVHTRYKQYVNGVPVEGTMVITHSYNGKIKSVNGEYYQHINPASAAGLSEESALRSALKKVNAKKYMWENKAFEAAKKEALHDPSFTFYPKGELVVVHKKGADYSASSLHLAYKFNIYAEVPLYRANVFVDASTGEILDEKNQICTADVVGTGVTKFSGTVPMTCDNTSGPYRLRESGRGLGINTYNMNNTSTYSQTDFTNSSTTWNLAGNNQAAADAHWGAEKTYDYYSQIHNRNSIDGAGYALNSYMHYSTNYVNAYWNGTEMTYGDGDVSQGFLIMTALDVCGHEITHGLTSFSSQLNGGGTDEASALNEGNSDIFGTTIEWFARPTQHDWIMGADITCTTAGVQNHVGIRNMSNPKSLNQPDCYTGVNWDPAGECHNNNGPFIYWYYLLCQGGSGTNDLGNAWSVTGITMAEARMIAFRGNTVYFTPNTTYADARVAMIQAAKDLYGACSNEVVQTTNAWYAVGVGTQYAAATIAPAFAANQTNGCVLPAVISFSNSTAAGNTYSWVFGDGTTSTATSPTHTYTSNGTYSVKLVATGCAPGSKDSVIKTSYITLNAPATPTASGANICNSGSGTLYAGSSSGNINWYNAASNGTLVGTGNSYTTPNLSTTTTYYAVSTVSQSPIYGGPANNTVFGGGSNFNGSTTRYLIFDVLQPCTLNSVVVYANSAGNRVIELRNSSSAVVQSATVNIPAGTQTVTLNFNLTPGTAYQLGTGGTLVDLYRNNSGSGYPYNIGNLVNITGADAGSSYYYYYYNWQVQAADCQSSPVAVTANVTVCTGITESSKESSIQVYPNPASDQLTFALPKEMLGIAKSIEVYDALGKNVKTIAITSSETKIDVSDLAKGVYSCRIVNLANEKIVKRFIKD